MFKRQRYANNIKKKNNKKRMLLPLLVPKCERSVTGYKK